MAKPQIISLQEAVALIPDGACITFSGFTIWRRPMAAVYEMIRQGKRNLHLAELGGGTHSELLIGAGCVKIWESSWMGHEMYGKMGANLARKAERGEIIIEDYSLMHMLARLTAGSMGLPYMPSYASMGTDILNPAYDNLGQLGLRDGSNPKIPNKKYEIVRDNFYDSELLHLPAVNPDWCIAAVQTVGEEGTVRISGQVYVDSEATKASDKVIVLAENIVPEEYLRREPTQNHIPGYQIDYIVDMPWAAHPTGSFGHYETDGAFIGELYQASRRQETMDQWLREWVYDIPDHAAYLDKLGVARLEALRANPVLGYSNRVKRGTRA
ncbi:MAG: CoA-transferase [Syntrophomonadaceae bacterium]|nr:CoA-transferase [Syntrophomonadaceae bacterium]